MLDLEYTTVGMFTLFIPNTPAGEDGWRVMAKCDGCGAILTVHLVSVLRQIRKAGLTVGKHKYVALPVSNDELLAELMS